MDVDCMINYNNRQFIIVKNDETGEVDENTRFVYFQEDNTVWAIYAGGSIVRGSLIAKVAEDGSLDLIYHHINMNNEFRTGKSFSKPEILEDGRIRLVEQWQGITGNQQSGISILEEIKKE